MKLFFDICLFALVFSASAQDKNIHIRGKVTCDRGNYGVENALVYLKLSGGYTFTYKTDSSGEYHFNFGMRTPSSCTLTVSTNKDSKAGYVRNGCFLGSKDTGLITELHDSVDYVKDFVIAAAFCEYEPSPILFYANSILNCNDSLHKINPKRYDTIDSIVQQLHQFLKADTVVGVEFLGHASSPEKNAEAISLYRAQLMCALLAAKGINPKRLSAKGYGNRKLLVTDDQIKKAQGQEQKATFHLRNQRVVYRLFYLDPKED